MTERRTGERRASPMGVHTSAVLSVRIPNDLFDEALALARCERQEIADYVRGLLRREVQRKRRVAVNISADHRDSLLA